MTDNIMDSEFERQVMHGPGVDPTTGMPIDPDHFDAGPPQWVTDLVTWEEEGPWLILAKERFTITAEIVRVRQGRMLPDDDEFPS